VNDPAVNDPAVYGPAGNEIGCVVIGRNEARRLRQCLQSVLAGCTRVVYVDSGSTDGSVSIARALGVPVLELDPSRPFSAARARNEGLARLISDHGDRVAFVQFVDGDCRLEAGWLDAGARALRGDRDLGVVAGVAREETPSASVFNRLCDIELDVPADAATECGGVAMMRVDAVRALGGYDLALPAGEEPDLCLRLRRAGWRIRRLHAPMMRHHLAMVSWRQWWARNARAGRAYLDGWRKHRREPGRFRRREVARILFWGGAVPLVALAAILACGSIGALALCTYLIPASGAWRWARRRGRSRRDGLLYAGACVAGKLPEFCGVVQSFWRGLRRTHRAA
jgi:GT2 family glycosyltransferase